jgi:transglutaminase-like putative cysteine protease
MESWHLAVGCDFTYLAAVPTPTVFQVEPAGAAGITTVSARWTSEPEMALRDYHDLYGNRCTRVVLPEGRSSFSYDALLLVPDATEDRDPAAPEVAAEELPDEVLIYTLPSRYCLPDVLGDEAWRRFGLLAPGYRRVQAICDHVNSHLTFSYGSTTSWTTAADVNHNRLGVCRDFTHLAISFCRALNIPARYVFGYLPDLEGRLAPEEMDFAAWMEVWLGDRWWTFDPRNNTARKGRVVIGRGRDASDVAMATTFGGPLLEGMRVRAARVSPARLASDGG